MNEITQNEIIQNWKGDLSKPLVSVRCITYNHENYIGQALDSFLMQKTNFPFEVIVHDDASTDNTANIIREYEKKFPIIIKPIYETENQYSKPGVSLMKIVEAACNGKYIALCEGDDYWIDENKLQMQCDFLEKNSDYGLCYTNFNIYNQHKQFMKTDMFSSGIESFQPIYTTVDEWIYKAGYVAPMTWFYRKDLMEKIDTLDSCDGSFVRFAYFLNISKVYCFKEKITAVYRLLPESASHSRNIEKLYNRVKNLFDTKLKLIELFNLNKDLIIKCSKNYYSVNWKLFIALGKKEYIDESIKVQDSFFIKFFLILGKIKIFSVIFKYAYIILRKFK